MEAPSFDVDSGLGSLPRPGAVTGFLVPPHTISKLPLEDAILDLQLPAAAPELPPVIQDQMVNAGAPTEVEINASQLQDQPVMAHDKRCYRDHLRNYQYPYAPYPDEDVPVDDDEYVTDDEDSCIATSSGPESNERRIGEPVEESPNQLDRRPVEESFTKEMVESTQSERFVSTFSSPPSTSTDGEPLDMATPALEPLLLSAKAGTKSEEQANPDQ